ncbi:MAG: sigma-70 family RNA polymerase sigma factor [Planctomycetales bacterium]|nr:sigma-70 family RNA polymerase sigma factor [Planctomycetales bacterium]
MAANEPDFDALMSRLHAGDPEAASEVFRLFSHRLIGLARNHLADKLKRKVDPEDIAQSVLKSFFVRQAQDAFELSSFDSLWGLLAMITVRKCGHRFEYFAAQGRDVDREITGSMFGDASNRAWEVVAKEPTPAQAAILTETIENLMRGLEPRERQILELALQGYTPPEISDLVSRSERTVRRILQRVREQLEQTREGEAANLG